MSEVKRYDPSEDSYGNSRGMKWSPYGDYVLAADYDALKEERDKLAVLLSFGRDHVANARHDVEVRSMNGYEASTLVLAGIDQWLADINAALAEANKP